MAAPRTAEPRTAEPRMAEVTEEDPPAAMLKRAEGMAVAAAEPRKEAVAGP
jgi:hypothetical protein